MPSILRCDDRDLKPFGCANGERQQPIGLPANAIRPGSDQVASSEPSGRSSDGLRAQKAKSKASVRDRNQPAVALRWDLCLHRHTRDYLAIGRIRFDGPVRAERTHAVSRAADDVTPTR